MGFKLFDEISTEDAVVAAKGNTTLDICDVITIEEAEADFNAAANEVDKLLSLSEEGEEMAKHVARQIETEEAILAKPETIAASTVTLSFESLKVTAELLGADLDALNISSESIDKSPADTLAISIEEKESLLKRIIAKIKEMFKAVKKFIKQMITKVTVAVAGVEKKAEAIKAKVDNLDDKNAPKEIDEKTVEKIKAVYSYLVVAGVTADNVKSIIDYSGGINAKYLKDKLSISKVEETLSKLGDDAKENANLVKKLIEESKKILKDNINGEDNKPIQSIIVGVSKDSISYLTIDEVEVAEELSKEEAVKTIAKIKLVLKTSKITEDSISGSKVGVLKKADLVKISDAISKEAKEVKSYVKDYESLQEAAEKVVDEADKTKLAEDLQAGLTGAVATANTIGSKVTSTMLKSYLWSLKASINVVNLYVNTFKDGDK